MQTIRRLSHWEWIPLFVVAFATRLYLLRVYEVELSNDGFDAVNMITTWQTQGIVAVSNEGITRLVLHPFYSVLLYALRICIPASIDFYLAARLLSTLISCIAIIILFEWTRRAFGGTAAWIAALFLTFAPSFLWESISILSSALFLALYLATLGALIQSRYRQAIFLAFLSAITRTEGVVLIALVLLALGWRDIRVRKIGLADWLVCIAFALAVPLTIVGSSWLATGNPLAFVGAQSIATIWLRFMAPGDFAKHAAFFITQYPALLPSPMVWLGVIGAIAALIWQRTRATVLLWATSALYLLFFETLVWFDYTTLETRFLMYPGLPLIVFAGLILSMITEHAPRNTHHGFRVAYSAILALVVVALLVASSQQAEAGLRFIYNSQASMRQMADELAQIFPKNQRVNALAYGGTSGALDMFARKRNIDLAFTEFRFAPDDNPERYIIENKIQYVIYPVGNVFAKAKYPYLAQFDEQTHNGVTFTPISQFATTTDNQLYSIWSVHYP